MLDTPPFAGNSCPSCAETIVVPFDPPEEAERHGLKPFLMRSLRDKIFQKLLTQRAETLAHQEQATSDLAELEARLEKLQAPLQERLRAYEQRIEDLEKELARKGQENQALIRLRIQVLKSQMAATKERLELN